MTGKALRIRHNIAHNLIFSVLPVGLFLFTVPLYIHTIGTERYGILSLVWVLAGYVGFMNFGSGDALIHSIAGMHDAPREARERMVWSGLWTTLALGAVAAILVWLIGEIALRQTVRASPDLLLQIHNAIPWVMLSVVASFVYGAIAGVIEGLERFLIVNVARFAEGVLTALLPLGVAIFVSPRLDYLVAATVVCSILPAAVLMVYLVVQLPLTRIHPPRLADCGKMLRFGGWLTVTSIISPLMTTLDRFVIGAVLGPAAVSHYVVPQGFVGRFAAFPAAIARTLFPRLASLAESGGAAALSGRAVRVVGAIMAPLCCGAILVVEAFLAWWIGPDFARTAGPVAQLLFFAMFFNSVALIPFNHMRGTGDPRTPALIHVVELVPYLLLAWGCIHAFGIWGAALAWSARVIVDFLLMCRSARLDARDIASLVPLSLLMIVALALARLDLAVPVAIAIGCVLGGASALVGLYVSEELRVFALRLLPRALVPAGLR